MVRSTLKRCQVAVVFCVGARGTLPDVRIGGGSNRPPRIPSWEVAEVWITKIESVVRVDEHSMLDVVEVAMIVSDDRRKRRRY